MTINFLKKHHLKLSAISASLLIALSMIAIIPTLYFHYSHKGTVSAVPLETTAIINPKPGVPVVSGQPINISIPNADPDLDINVGIVKGYYNTKTETWNVGLSVAQYVPLTAPPNNLRGDTYIFGHYRPAVFAYLHHIVPGTTATVTTANGYAFTYKYVDTYATPPTDIGILEAYKGPPILTVQTCSGSFFQNRQFYVFNYVSYQKLTT